MGIAYSLVLRLLSLLKLHSRCMSCQRWISAISTSRGITRARYSHRGRNRHPCLLRTLEWSQRRLPLLYYLAPWLIFLLILLHYRFDTDYCTIRSVVKPED